MAAASEGDVETSMMLVELGAGAAFVSNVSPSARARQHHPVLSSGPKRRLAPARRVSATRRPRRAPARPSLASRGASALPQAGLTAAQLLSSQASPEAGAALAERAEAAARERAAAEAERQRRIRMARLDVALVSLEKEVCKLEARSATI